MTMKADTIAGGEHYALFINDMLALNFPISQASKIQEVLLLCKRHHQDAWIFHCGISALPSVSWEMTPEDPIYIAGHHFIGGRYRNHDWDMAKGTLIQ